MPKTDHNLPHILVDDSGFFCDRCEEEHYLGDLSQDDEGNLLCDDCFQTFSDEHTAKYANPNS